MRQVRAAAAAAVLLFLITAPAFGQCVSSVTTLSERGDDPRFLAGPTAWNGHILAVAGTELDREEFHVILYDEHGNRLAHNEKIRSTGTDLLEVIWTGAEFGVFSITEDGVLGLTRVGTDGKVIGPRILPIEKIELGTDEPVEVLWSSMLHRYVVAHTEINAAGDRTVFVTLLQQDGRLSGQTLITDEARIDSFVRIAIASTGTIGVFFEHERSREVVYVALDGDRKSGPLLIWTPGEDIVVAARNDEFALLRRVLNQGDWIVRWMTIDTSGELVRPDSRLNAGISGDVEPLFLIGRDSEYALSYLEWAEGLGVGEPVYRLLRFGPDEEPISDTTFSAAAGTRRRRERTDFGFVWTGRAYLSLASNENGDDNDTFLVRLCPLHASISAPRSARPSQLVSFMASVDGGVPGYTYAWTWSGGSAQGPVLETSFANYGVEEIHLTVRDATGTETKDTFLLTINQTRRRPVRK
jgi:hypothetical protein